MLGWMLKRGENAPTADAGETTLLDQPDTPAPVFAARAFKSALFGTPAPSTDETRQPQGNMATRKASMASDPSSSTPSKPAGILLTPGTGTSRRKRVSFGRDLPATSKSTAKNDKAGSNRQSLLTEALENSRRNGKAETARKPAEVSDDEWEEAEDDYCTNDITLDLNEPHSQSGRYWKGEFEKYHQEAKAEMEKLLKYKQLAKSYAQQKDSEAIHLAEKLRDEQQKVIKMERKIAENASHIVSKHGQSHDDEPTALLMKLAKQTSLAAQYRHRVQELEANWEALLRQKEDSADSGRQKRQETASPMTQKTLVETQRELRRARSQLREVDSLRQEVASLKVQLKVAEARSSKDAHRNRESAGPRARELRAQLEQAMEESKKKDEELRKLKVAFEAVSQENEAHQADTKAVLERAYTKIASLKQEVKALKATGAETLQRSSWQPNHDGSPEAGTDWVAKMHRGAEYSRRKHESADNEAATKTQLPRHTVETATTQGSGNALAERPSLGQPKWRPFVPRSPRNRAYLGEALEKRIRNGGATPAPPRSKRASVTKPPESSSVLSRDVGRETSGRADEVDLLQNRFERLGGPDHNRAGDKTGSSSGLGNRSKGRTISTERRAAALARIEKSMAEKKRSQRRKAYDKENMLPWA
ncbi:hypothetical protein RJ55_05469 [Drechmeria coniospora]|nr:hypothetical protein RJ55_05469 [Drechmeria coniospora]